jgi:hypothetical protein
MRLRFVVLASALSALAAVCAPGAAVAAPVQDHGLTINATPNPIVSGDPVLIYGQLTGPDRANREIVLYHRVAGAAAFTSAGATRTNAAGFYEFTRAEHVVLTNRSWFARAPFLPGNVHSHTIAEQVAAAVSLGAFTPSGTATVSGDTAHPIVFTGHVDPPFVHRGEAVMLQAQTAASGDDWHTIDTGVIAAGSNFSIVHRFRIPGARALRVLFAGDVRNTSAVSDPLDVTIQQTQQPSFTITTSAPIVDAGASATISGVLSLPATASSTLVADPNVPVTLWARASGLTNWQPVAHTTTGNGTTAPAGSYAFTVAPMQNTNYKVTTSFTPPAIRSSAVLYEAVRDLVSIAPSSTSVNVGQPVAFTGAVTPDQTGGVVYLERLGKDGDFHIVRIQTIRNGSVYRFIWIPGTPGTYTYRAVVPGGNHNAAGFSPPVTITVALPNVATLPGA